ncbi:NHL domain-containing protein [Catenulispora rubra]|uniref:NHL domain-containing protein n=1 Tax=Catenulispora rubra TaxID=280293 RepID=UPI002B264D6E|nr:SGNH/GDSL hydrolase family protein [Catenulispora rubra]
MASTIVPVLASSPASATTPTISAFAGTGTAGFSGDGGAATSAQLNQPKGLATDSAGNVYVVDAGNLRIRKVTTSGTISTAVGSGSVCSANNVGNTWSLDFGMCNPTWLAAAPGGSAYFNDGGWLDQAWNTGVQAHVAGKVTGNYSPGDGDGFGVSVNANSATVGDDGTVYFGEGNSLKAWNPATKQVTTIAGMSGGATCNYYASDGAAALGACIFPQFVSFSRGSIYFFDMAPGWRGPVIFRIDLSESRMQLHKVAGSGSWSDYGSGGLAVNAGISTQGPIAVSSIGEVYFGGVSNGVIRKVDTSGYMRDVVGVGTTEGGMAFDGADNLYVSLPSQNKVVKVSGLGPVASKGNLVALGDSVAAGEGINYGFIWNPTTAEWFQSNPNAPTWTDTTSATGANYQDCHQTDYAYSRLLQANGYQVYNMACSGASVLQNSGLESGGILDNENFADGFTPTQLGGLCSDCEPVNSTFDSHNPTVVTLTIGANDVTFANWVTQCYLPGAKCGSSDDSGLLSSQLGIEQADLRSALAELNRRAGQDLPSGQTLRVLVTNYYDPFQSAFIGNCVDTDGGHLGNTFPGVGIESPQQTWLVNALTSLNANINSEVNYAQANDPNLNVSLIDLSNVMAGHQWCSNDPWMYGPSINYSGGNNPAPFHPTPAGQNAIYQAVLQQGHL